MTKVIFRYNIILPICILFIVNGCNQTNTKVINVSLKKDTQVIIEKQSNQNFLKEKVLKQKVKIKNKEDIPHNNDQKIIFEFKTERLLQGRNPEHLLHKQKTEKAMLAVSKMLKQNLSLLNKNMDLKEHNKKSSYDPYTFKTNNSYENNNILTLLPLTGKFSNFGRDIRKSLDLSLLQVAPNNIQIIYYDTGKEIDLKKIKNLMETLNPQIIIGPFTREALLEVKPLIKEKRIPVITFTNDIALLENNIWSLGFSPEEQIESVIACALQNKFNRFGLILPNNLYGQIILKSSSDLIGNAKTLHMEKLLLNNEQVNNKSALLAKLKNFLKYNEKEEIHTKFDAILIAGSKDFILEIAPLLAFFNVDSKSVKILGTEIFNHENIRNEPSLEKAWFPIIYNKDDHNYKQILKDTWNKKSNYFSSIGFDSGLLAFDFLKSDKKGIEYFQNAVSPLVGFVFKKNGKVEKPINIMEINNLGKLSIVKGC